MALDDYDISTGQRKKKAIGYSKTSSMGQAEPTDIKDTADPEQAQQLARQQAIRKRMQGITPVGKKRKKNQNGQGSTPFYMG